MKCSRHTQCHPVHFQSRSWSKRELIWEARWRLMCVIARWRMWWFRFLSSGHEVGRTLHPAIAAPAPGFSAEDMKVTQLTSGVKLPPFLSAAWLTLHAFILSGHASVVRVGVMIPQLPKSLYNAYLLKILCHSICFLGGGAWRQFEVFSRHQNMQTITACTNQPFADLVQPIAWSCLRKTKLHRRFQRAPVCPRECFVQTSQQVAYFTMLFIRSLSTSSSHVPFLLWEGH